jgi:hypothetical protein
VVFGSALDAVLRPGGHLPAAPADLPPLQHRLSAHQALIVHADAVVDLALPGAGHCQTLRLPVSPSTPPTGAPR